jgi:hypothetical protein
MEAKDAVVIQTGFHEELDAAKETFDTLDGKFALLETTTAGWKRTICFLLCMLLLLHHQKRCRQSEYRLLKDTRP